MNTAAFSLLRPREQEIVTLLLEGCVNAEIADRTGLKLRTVKLRLASIFRRLKIKPSKRKRVYLVNMMLPIDSSHFVSPPCELTEREWKIVKLVGRGLTSEKIAVRLGTAEQTIKNYLRVIYDKLGVWNRTELAIWYVRYCDNNTETATVECS